MRKFNISKRRITKKLQLLLISYLVMTQAVPVSLPHDIVAITAFAETIEHAHNTYTVNGEDGKTYNIEENTDNSSIHAKGNDITIEVNGDTREVYFDGNKQDITVNGDVQSIQDTQSANKDNNLHVTGDIVDSSNGNANSINQGYESTVTVGGSVNVDSVGLYNGSSLSTGTNTDGTSSGKSGDITVSGGINVAWASDLKANGDVSANNINIEGNQSNIGSNVEATGNVTAHHITMSKKSELTAKGVEATKDPNDSHSGNIDLYTGSIIRTTQDGIKAEGLHVDNGKIDTQKISLNTKDTSTITNHSQVSAEQGITISGYNIQSLLVDGDSTVNGNVDANENITVQGNSTINGDVSGYRVDIKDKSTVTGNIIGYGYAVIDDSTVDCAVVTAEGGSASICNSSTGKVESDCTYVYSSEVHGSITNWSDSTEVYNSTTGDVTNNSTDSETTIQNSTVNGNVKTQHGATISGNTHVTGNVETSNENLNIDGGDTGTVKIDGNINTNNDYAEIHHAEIGGTINTAGLSVENSTVHKGITANGDVWINNSSTKEIVNGSDKYTGVDNSTVVSDEVAIDSGYVSVNNSNITGDINAALNEENPGNANVEITDSTVDGNITAQHLDTQISNSTVNSIDGKAVKIEDNSKIHGDINTTKSTTVKDSQVDGTIQAGTSAELTNATAGNVYAEEEITATNSTVKGELKSDGYNGYAKVNKSTIDGKTTVTNTLTSNGSTFNDDISANKVNANDGTTINGNINNAATVKGDGQVIVNGDIECGYVEFNKSRENSGNAIAEVNGDIKANSVTLRDTRVSNSTHTSTIEAHKAGIDASVSVEGNSEIDNISSDSGYIAISGNSKANNVNGSDSTSIDVHDNASVNNIAGGFAYIDGNATANDIDITARGLSGGTVSVHNSANVHDISGSAKSSVTVSDNAVANDIQGGEIHVDKNATVHNITSDADSIDRYGDSTKNIYVKGEATVTGDITANYKADIVVAGTAHTDNANVQNNGTGAVYVGGNSSDNYEHFNKLLEAGEIKAEDSASINSIKSENGNVEVNTEIYFRKSANKKGSNSEYIVHEDLSGKTVTVGTNGKLLIGGDFKATTAKFYTGSEVDVLGNYTADVLDADNNTAYVKGNSNTGSIVAKDGNSAKVDGTATVGNQGVTSDRGTVEVEELVIKQNTGSSDTNIQATNGGTITVNNDLDTTEAIASASKSGKGIKLEADGGNSVIHIKGDVSDTNKDNKSVGMNAVATNNGIIQIDGDAEGKYTADGGTVNIGGTAKVKEFAARNGGTATASKVEGGLISVTNDGTIHITGDAENNDYIEVDNSVINVDDSIKGNAVIEVDNDSTMNAKNGISGETVRSLNNSTIKSDGDIKINGLTTVDKGGAVTTDKKFIGGQALLHKDGNLNAKEGIETGTLSIGDLGGNTVSTLGSIIADNIRSESSYDLGELGERNKVTAGDTIKGAINTKSELNFKRTGTDFESNKVEITGKSDMEDTNIKANSLTLTAKDGAEPDMKMSGGVLDISGNIKIKGVLENNDSIAKMSLNDTDVKIGGTVTSNVDGHSSQLEVIGGEHNNSLVLNKGTDNVGVKTDKASADIKGNINVHNESESGAVQVKEGNLKLTDGNLVYTTSNNEEVKVNHGDIELSSKDAIQLIETGHDVVLLENYNVNSTGNGIAGSFEKLDIDDKSSLTVKGTGIRSLAETAEITAQTDVIGEEYGVESGSQLKYVTADSVVGGKAAFLKDDFTKQDDITVWEAKGEKVIDSKNGTATAEQIEKAEKEIKYVIKQSDTDHGTIEIIPTIGTVSLTGSDGVEKTYNVALQDQIVRVKITPDTGYQVKSTSGRTAELKSVGDNIYELKVPRGGGINISALMEAIPEIPNTPDKPSTPSGGDGDSKGGKGGNDGNGGSTNPGNDKPSGGNTKPGNDKPSGGNSGNDKPSGDNSDNKSNTPSKPDKPSNNDIKPVVPSYNYSDNDDSDDNSYSDNKSMEEHTAIDSSTPHKSNEETGLNTEVHQEIENTESKINEQINNAGNNIDKIKEILAEETNAVKGTTVENNNKEIAVIDNHKTIEFGPSGIKVVESNSNNNYSAVVIEKSADGKVQCKDASGHAVSGIHVIITADSSDGDSNTAPSGMICLFNTEGYMQTGWSILSDENYYYFSTLDGHMFISSLTPDGFTVNELGQWNGEASIYNADLKVPNAQSHIYTGTHIVQ